MSAAVIIPWWGWIAIWGSLMLVMLGLFAWWLFRKAMVTLEHLGELTEATAILDGADDTPTSRAVPAVLLDLKVVRAHRVARVARRDQRRWERRERRMARARRITTADASRQHLPATWYRGNAE